MNGTIEFLLTYGYALVFFCVLAEQLGLPLPSTPVLLAAGALGGLGRLSLVIAWPLAVLASLIGDSVWFYLGKTRGMSVLRLLCRISLEPDTCVRKTKSAYHRHGANWLLFAKFVPGLSTIAPPMAGMFKVSPWRFIAMDAGGAGLWAGVFILAGWWFRDQLEVIASYLSRLGAGLGVAIGGSLLLYIAFRYIERQRVYRSLRIARITPQELKERIEAGEIITIIDLRNAFEWQEGRIPGSLTFSDEEMDAFVPAIPDAEMIIYCSCPNEISSAGAAIRLKRKGVKLVRPLAGGYPLWTDLGFPIEAPKPRANIASA